MTKFLADLGLPRRRWPAFTRPKVWVAHAPHENDEVYVENLVDYFEREGIRYATIELTLSGPQASLQQCIDDKPSAILGFNSQLDHSWLGDRSFISAAAEHGVPVVQWVLDHPGWRWPEFVNSTADNSAFLFHSEHSAQYFHRHCLPRSLVSTMGAVGPNRRSRADIAPLTSFLAREIPCLLPLNLSRGAETHVDGRIDALGAPAPAVHEAIASAFDDLQGPLDRHLSEALTAHNQTIDQSTFNRCFSLVDEAVQLRRRLQILNVAKNYPVLIQSCKSVHTLLTGKTSAEIVSQVGMRTTLERMPKSRGTLSVSNLNDMVHDRTMNGLNAGCAMIVEDNISYAGLFEHRKNALLFKYDDDSLRECFDIVCNHPREAYEIAEAGHALRDDPAFRFGQFDNILKLARKQRARLRGRAV